MIKTSLLFLTMMLFAAVAFTGSNPITNKKPSRLNAGRTAKITKVFRITDEQGGFFLKMPWGINVSKSGFIYVVDSVQLLKFDKNGKFIQNLIKKGQGPGELTNISNFLLLANDEIIIHNGSPSKIVKIDKSGKLLLEKRLDSNKHLTLLQRKAGQLYFLREEFASTKGKFKLVDMEAILFSASEKNYTIKKELSFPMKVFAFKSGGRYMYVRILPFLSSSDDGNNLYISHSAKYGIKKLDLSSSSVLLDFNRTYERVEPTDETRKFMPHGSFKIDGKRIESPYFKYMNDIQSIHFSNGKLWVFTSTVDKTRGVKVDIFDSDGRYFDCFYLKFLNPDSHYRLEQVCVKVLNDNVYFIEKDEDEDWGITKYAIDF